MSLVIGIDSGTQSVKAVVLDLESGRVAAEARAPHSLIGGLPPGHAEQHPQEWAAALDTVLGQVARRIERGRVRAIGIAGQQHGFVPLDGRGRVIRPAKLWCDTSTTGECAALTRRLGGPEAVIRLTGLPFLPGYTAPKVLWLKRREPARFRRLRHILLPHDYLNFHLTGRVSMEAGDASGTGFLDVRRRRWCPEAMAAVDGRVAGCLPAVAAGSEEPAGMLRPDLARAFGFPRDTLVAAGGGDNMLGAIGTGAVRPGTVTASLGTSATLYAFSRTPIVDPAGEIAAFCSSTGGWLPLACTMNATRVTGQVRDLFGWSLAEFDRAAAGAPAGAGGLALLPYLDGERTPNLPGACGVLHGLTRATFEPGHLARSALEGVTFGLGYGLGRLRALGVRPREIRLTGGGARSALWRQVAADVLGVPVVALAEGEGVALGAGLQAAACAGAAGLLAGPAGAGGKRAFSLGELCARWVVVDESTRCVPDRERRALYRKAQAAHDALRERIFGSDPASGLGRDWPRGGD